MRPLVFLAALAFAGCSSTPAVPADPTAALAGTTWTEFCPGSDPVRSLIRLDSDGVFAWSYGDQTELTRDGDELWTVDGTTLTVSWNGGYATTDYDLTTLASGQLAGVSSKDCGDQAVLERAD